MPHQAADFPIAARVAPKHHQVDVVELLRTAAFTRHQPPIIVSPHDGKCLVDADLVHVRFDRGCEGLEKADVTTLDLRTISYGLLVGGEQDGIRSVELEDAPDVALVVGGNDALDNLAHLECRIVVGTAGERRGRQSGENEKCTEAAAADQESVAAAFRSRRRRSTASGLSQMSVSWYDSMCSMMDCRGPLRQTSDE